MQFFVKNCSQPVNILKCKCKNNHYFNNLSFLNKKNKKKIAFKQEIEQM